MSSYADEFRRRQKEEKEKERVNQRQAAQLNQTFRGSSSTVLRDDLALKKQKEEERLKKQEAQQRLQSYQKTQHSLMEQVHESGMKQYKDESRRRQRESQQYLHSVQLNEVKIKKNSSPTALPSPSSGHVPDSDRMKHDDDDLTFKSVKDKAGLFEWSPTRTEVPVKDMSPKSVTMASTMTHDYAEDDGTAVTAEATQPTFLAASLEEDVATMEEAAQEATGIAPPPQSLVPPSVRMASTMAHDYVEGDGTAVTVEATQPTFLAASLEEDVATVEEAAQEATGIAPPSQSLVPPSVRMASTMAHDYVEGDGTTVTVEATQPTFLAASLEEDVATVEEAAQEATSIAPPPQSLVPLSVTTASTMAHDYAEDDGTAVTAEATQPMFLAASLEEDVAPMEEVAQETTGIAPPPQSLVPPTLSFTDAEDEAASSGVGSVDEDDDREQPPNDGTLQHVPGSATTVTADNDTPATNWAAADATSTVVTSSTDSTTPPSTATTTVESVTIIVLDETATVHVPTAAAATTHAPDVDETAAAAETTVPFPLTTPQSTTTTTTTETSCSSWQFLSCGLFV